jgi:2'-5' RNA ligase
VNEAATRRLFFALWPSAQVRAQLATVARGCSSRPVPEEKLHLTLVFLGQRDAQQTACFCQAAAGVRCEPFELQLDYLGGWPRAGIQWLGSSRMPESLTELVRGLTRNLQPCGYEAEKRPFVAHITLARRVRHPKVKSGLEAIRWPVSDFVLVETVAGSGGARYQVLQRWALAEDS